MKIAVRAADRNGGQLTNTTIIFKFFFAKQMALAYPKSSFVLTAFNSL